MKNPHLILRFPLCLKKLHLYLMSVKMYLIRMAKIKKSIPENSIINLTGNMSADGLLKWNAPKEDGRSFVLDILHQGLKMDLPLLKEPDLKSIKWILPP